MSTPPESVAYPSTPATSFADTLAAAITDPTNYLSYQCYNCNDCFLTIPITSTATATASPTSFLCPHHQLIPHHIISPPLSPPPLPSLPSPSPPTLLDSSPQSLNSAPLCSICWVELLETQNDSDTSTTVTILPCQHYFHRDCIAQWYNHSRTCPMCRRQFSLDSAVLAPEEETVTRRVIEESLGFILGSGSLTATEEDSRERSVWDFGAMRDEDGDILMVDEDGDILMVDA